MNRNPPSSRRLEPSPAELMNFCREIGIDLFGEGIRSRMAWLQGPSRSAMQRADDYTALFHEVRNARSQSIDDRLRLGLNLWMDVSERAQRVINETKVPAKFAKDARLAIRWLRSKNQPIPQKVADEAEARWSDCFKYDALSEQDAIYLYNEIWNTRGATGQLKTGLGLDKALRLFGCPNHVRSMWVSPRKRLEMAVTIEAVSELGYLNYEWSKAANTARPRRGNNPRKRQNA